MNNKYYVADLFVYEIYGALQLLNKTEKNKQIKKSSVFEDSFKYVKFEHKLTKNLSILLGKNNLNVYDFRKQKIIDKNIKEIIYKNDIDEFYKWFNKKINFKNFANKLLKKLKNEFKTSEIKKAYYSLKEIVLISFNRKGSRQASAIALLLQDYGFIKKIKNGKFRKNTNNKKNLKSYKIEWEGKSFDLKTKKEFAININDFINKQNDSYKNLLKRILDENKLFPFSNNTSDITSKKMEKREKNKRDYKSDQKAQKSSEKNSNEAEEETFKELKKNIGKSISKIISDLNISIIKKVIPYYKIDSNKGFDIGIKTEDGKEYKLEIKSIISSGKARFFISKNEYETLSKSEDSYIVFYKNSEDIRICDFNKIKNKLDLEISQYYAVLRDNDK